MREMITMPPRDRSRAVRYPAPSPILELVGNTPLLRLNEVTRDLPRHVEVYAKAEWYNPAGSIKESSPAGV